jgi:Zn-dependent protease with chaperone function
VDSEEFSWLISRLEAEAANKPAAFRAKVILISCAAYIVLFIALALYAAFVVMGWMYIAEKGVWIHTVGFALATLAALPVFYGVLRILMTPLPPPTGRRITAAEAPVLFDLLAKMGRKLGGPPIHHVLVDEDYNASICQLPRWGLVGPVTNYLTIGLPYMLGGQTSEIMSVIAHEYGHLCGAHGKLHAWIYRQRGALEAVHRNVGSSKDGSPWHAMMAWLLDRFMPYHDAYTFVLARQDEYDADRIASNLTGPEARANGLVRARLQGHWYHKSFWPALYRQSETRDQPAFMPYQAMHTAFKMAYLDWATEDGLKRAWKVESNVDDTHPCLRDRVEALGLQARLPQPITANAASALLGDSAKRLVEEFDRAWWQRTSRNWGSHRRHVARSRDRLQELARLPIEDLPLHELQELAVLKLNLESSKAAKLVLEHLLRRPGGPFPKAEYTYGSILLGDGDSNGLTYLRNAALNDRRLSDDALRSGYAYLAESHGEDEAQAWVDETLEAA